MSCEESDVSFAMSTVGLIIPFVITDGIDASGMPIPISNSLSANVTWIAQNGVQRPLTLTIPVSAVFIYQVTLRDSRTPHTEQGYLQVSFGTNVFYTSSFTVNVAPHFQ